MLINFELLWLMICFAGSVRSEILSAKDAKVCTDLCSGCGGTSTFDNGVCDCLLRKNDEKSDECSKHVIKQRKEPFNHESTDSVAGTANRDKRCPAQRSRQRLRSGDLDRVINYFVNDGPRTGMPLLGNPNVDYPSDDPKNAGENCGAPLPPGRAEPFADEAPIDGNNHREWIENHAPIAFSAKSPSFRALEFRSVRPPRNSILGAVSNGFLKIPHILADIVNPGYRGMQYSPLCRITQFFNTLGRLYHSPMFNLIAAGVHGIPRSVDDPASSYVPENYYEHMFGAPEDDPMNPYLGIPNALLAGVQTPSYYPGLMPSGQFPRSVGPAVFQDFVEDEDETKMMENQLGRSELSHSQQSRRGVEGNSNLLYEAIKQQNAILDSLNQQLRNYSPRAETQNYLPLPYNFRGSPAPTEPCRCYAGPESSVPGTRSDWNARSSGRTNVLLENSSFKTESDSPNAL